MLTSDVVGYTRIIQIILSKIKKKTFKKEVAKKMDRTDKHRKIHEHDVCLRVTKKTIYCLIRHAALNSSNLIFDS